MSATQGVTHPEVTHPASGAQGGGNAPSGKAPKGKEKAGKPGRWKVPPAPVLLAAGLTVAAVELLLWQVAGVVWAVAVHLVAAVVAVVVVVVVVRSRRNRKGGRKRDRGRDRSSAGSPLAWLRRLPGVGRALSRRPGGVASPSGPGATSARRRGPLSRLADAVRRRMPGGGRKGATPGGPGATGGRKGATPGATPKGKPGLLSRLRWPKSNRRDKGATPGGGGATPDRGKSKKDKSKKGKKDRPSGKKRSWLPAFLRGVNEGAEAADKAATKVEEKVEKRKPSPYPRKPDADGDPKQKKPADASEGSPEPARPAEKPKQQASTSKPAATVAAPSTGGHMSNPQVIKDLADQLGGAFKAYEPESMHDVVRDLPAISEALAAVADGIRAVASRADSDWPLAPEVVDAIRSIADDIRAGADTASEARAAMRKHNETDIERGEAPRKGSRDIESQWDVGRY